MSRPDEIDMALRGASARLAREDAALAKAVEAIADFRQGRTTNAADVVAEVAGLMRACEEAWACARREGIWGAGEGGSRT